MRKPDVRKAGRDIARTLDHRLRLTWIVIHRGKMACPADRVHALSAENRRILAAEPGVGAHLAAGRYTPALKALAALRGDVDAFFDQVMVNAEDPRLRANRHALLRRLGALMNQVADISKLAA